MELVLLIAVGVALAPVVGALITIVLGGLFFLACWIIIGVFRVLELGSGKKR
jgi:hypothetical protein